MAAATAHLSQVERYCWRVAGFGRVPLRLPGWLLLVLALHSLHHTRGLLLLNCAADRQPQCRWSHRTGVGALREMQVGIRLPMHLLSARNAVWQLNSFAKTC